MKNATLLEELPKVDLIQIKKSCSQELLELISNLEAPIINPIVKIEKLGPDFFVLSVPHEISKQIVIGLNDFH